MPDTFSAIAKGEPTPRGQMTLLPDALTRGMNIDAALMACRTREDCARTVLERVPQADAHNAAHALYAHWQWLRQGRRIYVLDAGTIDALLSAPLAVSVPPIAHAMVVQWAPHPRLDWKHSRFPMPYAGAWLTPPVLPHEGPPTDGGIGAYTPAGDAGDGSIAAGSVACALEYPGRIDCDNLDVLIWTFLAALADPRVSQVVTFPRGSVAARKAEKSRTFLRKLQLTPDAQGVWATQRIGPPLPKVHVEERAAPGAHVVPVHTARYWVSRLTHPDAVAEVGEDGAPILRNGKSGPLVAVRLPVREHVRGSGECAAKITRVVPS